MKTITRYDLGITRFLDGICHEGPTSSNKIEYSFGQCLRSIMRGYSLSEDDHYAVMHHLDCYRYSGVTVCSDDQRIRPNGIFNSIAFARRSLRPLLRGNNTNASEKIVVAIKTC